MSSKESLLQAAEQALGERALHGRDEHLSPDTLIAYYEGRLSDDEDEEVRDHLTLCQDCADLALDFKAFAAIEPTPEDHSVPAAAAEADWQAVRSRIRFPPPPARQKLPKVWIALAASFFLTTLGSSYLALQYKLALQERAEPVIIAVAHSLIPEEDPVLADESETVATVPARAQHVVVYLHLPDVPVEAEYLVEILASTDPDAEALWSGLGLPSPEGYLIFGMDRDFLPAGPRRVRLYSLDGELKTSVANYTLNLEYMTSPSGE